ncbi:Tctex-1 [Lipomyces japonicus]|uniref:Tctex-1 n=1 Tax=Lipomyces japonicus TaxID=56871 RepID=UPI0034CEDF8B
MTVLKVPNSTTLSSSSKIPLETLTETCTNICADTLPPDTVYDASKTSSWNEKIVHGILNAVTALSPKHKFIVYATLIRQDYSSSSSIHTTSGAFWNNKTDGLWNFSWSGGDKEGGVNVVISLAWIGKD